MAWEMIAVIIFQGLGRKHRRSVASTATAMIMKPTRDAPSSVPFRERENFSRGVNCMLGKDPEDRGKLIRREYHLLIRRELIARCDVVATRCF